MRIYSNNTKVFIFIFLLNTDYFSPGGVVEWFKALVFIAQTSDKYLKVI